MRKEGRRRKGRDQQVGPTMALGEPCNDGELTVTSLSGLDCTSIDFTYFN